MPTSKEVTCWRASGWYLLRLASKTSLLEEVRLFFLTYAHLRNSEATRLALVNGGLPQRSRATHMTITEILQIRFTRWNPPTWVLDDLITFAQEGHQTELQASLLLHTARQSRITSSTTSSRRLLYRAGLLVNANLSGLMCNVFSIQHRRLIQKWKDRVTQRGRNYQVICSPSCVILVSFKTLPQCPSKLLNQQKVKNGSINIQKVAVETNRKTLFTSLFEERIYKVANKGLQGNRI